MEIRPSFLWMLLGASLVTLLPRILPLIVLSRIRLPDWGLRWLGHIPIAVMSALLAQELLVSKGAFSPQPVALLAAVPAFAVAYFTRSLLGTVVTGIAATMLFRYLSSLLAIS
ncbi:AzlD domain-containing protein [Paenibacillus oleatilyticus]|uniref:AzlD domain-containing protein n=1 Tax=Paenibacillus oleatilyticus TaxID=2594886 RepID=A0ABV4V6H4_9BACL|nr:AzlD domain-containing protein [Paenibacillus oleatilyticus]MBU7316957.1 AzlD domain-containing protein [Paenibacillus oleatilyticus]